MKLGVVFPQTEIGSDPAVIRDYAQAAESAGYDHLLVFDHVLGGKLERFDKLGRRPPYTDESPFHEVFVLFGYLGACTQRLELVTGIVILPQRQTALVAKQAAAVDVLTGGRLRLGVGIGWNHVEYEALNEDFHTRGRRVSGQIAVIRKLWTEPLVTFQGSYHHLDRAGINPLPVQRPIPVWMGGMAEPVLRRVAQISDGWFPQFQPGDEASHTLDRVRAYMKEAGRPLSAVGIEGRFTYGIGGPTEWAKRAREWRDLDDAGDCKAGDCDRVGVSSLKRSEGALIAGSVLATPARVESCGATIQTLLRLHPESCSQREPKRPRASYVTSANLRRVVCGAVPMGSKDSGQV